MKRMTGIEPASKAWEAFILPMNYIRKSFLLFYFIIFLVFVKSHFISIFSEKMTHMYGVSFFIAGILASEYFFLDERDVLWKNLW